MLFLRIYFRPAKRFYDGFERQKRVKIMLTSLILSISCVCALEILWDIFRSFKNFFNTIAPAKRDVVNPYDVSTLCLGFFDFQVSVVRAEFMGTLIPIHCSINLSVVSDEETKRFHSFNRKNCPALPWVATFALSEAAFFLL